MKRNTDYKNDALAALKGNWGKAVLATVIFMAVMYLTIGPYMYNTVKLQSYVRESMPQVSTSVSFSTAIRQSMEASLSMAQDPEYIAMQSKASGTMGLYYLLLFFVVLPLSVGFINAFLKLLVQGDNAISGNMFKIAKTGYWHKVWGMFLTNLFIALWVAVSPTPAPWLTGWTGVAKCALMAAVYIGCAWGFTKLGIKLKI